MTEAPVSGSGPAIDDLFAGLIKETEAFQARKRAAKAKPRPPQRTANGWTSGRASPLPSNQAPSRMEVLMQKRAIDFKLLQDGLLPGGWEIEGLVAHVVEYHCLCCHCTTRAFSPPEVFLVSRQVKHKETKFMRPLRPGEYEYHAGAAHTPLIIERSSRTIAICQICLGKPQALREAYHPQVEFREENLHA
jgi:hypothetical protein